MNFYLQKKKEERASAYKTNPSTRSIMYTSENIDNMTVKISKGFKKVLLVNTNENYIVERMDKTYFTEE